MADINNKAVNVAGLKVVYNDLVNKIKNINIGPVYKPCGTVKFADLPEPSAETLGYVYNIEDIEGLKSRYPAKHYDRTPTTHTQCLEDHIAAYARAENLTIDYVKDGGHCFYRPSEHMVRVPNKDEFKYDYGLYSSIMHEIIHSTSKGLNRDIGAEFGSEKYSKEELIAEIGSQMAYLVLFLKRKNNSTMMLHIYKDGLNI